MSAGVIGGVAGAAIGFMAGGPAGAQMGYALGSAVGTMFGPQPNTEGPRLQDKTLVTSTFGSPIPRIYGTYRTGGEVIFALPIIETSSTQSVGKGGGPTQTTYSYFGSFAIALCEGPILGVRRVWANGKLVFDASRSEAVVGSSGGFSGMLQDLNALNANGSVAQYMRVYTGSETQNPDSLLQANDPDTSAYRGVAYVVFENLPLGDYGNHFPNLNFEVVGPASNMADLKTMVISGPTYASSVYGAMPFVDAAYPDALHLVSWLRGDTAATALRLTEYDVRSNGDAYPTTTGYAGVPAAVTSGYADAFYRPLGCPRGGYAVVFNNNTVGNHIYTVMGGALLGRTVFSCGPGFPDGIYNFTSAVLGYDGSDIAALSGIQANLLAGVAPVLKIYLSNGRSYVASGPVSALFIESGYLYAKCRDLADASNHTTIIDVYDLNSDSSAPVATVRLTDSRFFFTAGGHSLYVRNGTVYLCAVQDITGDRHVYKTRPLSGDTTFTLIRSFKLSNLIDSTGTQNGWVWTSNGPGGGGDWMYCDGNVVILPGTRQIDMNTFQYGTVVLGLSGVPSSAVTIADIVTAECAVAGLDASLIDVSELTDTVDGYQIAQRSTTRQNLEPLSFYGFFDAVEQDWKVKFALRNRTPTLTIPEIDMGAAENISNTDTAIAWTRTQEVELPQEVSVSYSDSSADFSVGAKYARRLTTTSNKKSDMQLPIAMTPAKAALIAHRTLYLGWSTRNKAKWSTSQKYAALMPTDAVYVEQGDNVFPVRITRREDLPSGLIQFEGESLDARVITQNIPVAPTSGFETQTVAYLPPMSAKILDLPLLRDVDAARVPTLYAAAVPYADGWPGGNLFVSDVASGTYDLETAFTSAGGVGKTTTALPSWPQGSCIFDTVNSITVQFYGAVTLASITRTQALSMTQNIAYVGGEIVVFQNATLVGGTASSPIYRLSMLLRAQKGTDAYMSTHATGDDVVILDKGSLGFVPVPTDKIGVARYYKAVTAGKGVDQVSPMTATASNGGGRPLSPVFVAANKAASGDMLIKWVRRSRVDQAWRDYADVQLGETTESYQIDILDSAGSLKRTLSSTAQNVTYTSAQITTDFGSYPTSFKVRVYQISAIVGRGDPGIYNV